MGDLEWRSGRALRLEEQRQRRRNILATGSIALVATLVLGALAVARLSGGGSSGPKVVVAGASATSTTAAPLATTTTLPASPIPTLASTTTTRPRTTTTKAPTTTAAPTTAAPTTSAPTTSTSTTQPPTAIVYWGATPSSFTLQSGAQVSGTVHATNVGKAAGSVVTPGCPAPPQPHTGSGGGKVCAQGGPVVAIAPGQTLNWSFTLSATNTGDRTGQALPAGRYTVRIGSATVVLNVTP